MNTAVGDADPLVSVIVPVYRGVQYLSRAIESVLAQTDVSVELLIIDDGSPEDVAAAVLPYLDCPYIRLLTQENRGVSAARNHGLRLARGRFVAFLDHDDEWYPKKLSTQLTALAVQPAAALCHSDVDYMDADGGALPHAKDFPAHVSGRCVARILMGNPVITSTVLVRRIVFDQLGGFNEQLRYAEDYELWLRVAVASEFAYVDAPLAKYRVHDGNATRQTAAMVAATVHVLERFLDRSPEAAEALPQHDLRLRFARLHCALSRHCFTRGQWVRFARHWLAAWRQDCNETMALGLPGPALNRLRWYGKRLGLR